MNNKQNQKTITKGTINPYRSAAALILFRALWDLHPYSWKSRKKIREWKDKHWGEKAVILCNGPSLNQTNFDELTASGIFTFGLNKINLLFPRVDFRPSVIVAVNSLVIEQAASFYNETNIPIFLDSSGRKHVKFNENVYFLHSASSSGSFAKDCSVSINQGFTVTYAAMQLAFHMGFKEVALIGCDHSFDAKGPATETVISGKEDKNHFDPNYFAGGMKWQLPNLAGSSLYYDIAKDIFETHGRKILNCTEGGKLEVFPRQSLSKFLQKDN